MSFDPAKNAFLFQPALPMRGVTFFMETKT